MPEITDPAIVIPLEQRFRVRARIFRNLVLALKDDHLDYWANVNGPLGAHASGDVIMDQNEPTHPVTKADLVAMKAIEDAVIAVYDGAGNDSLLAKFAVTGP